MVNLIQTLVLLCHRYIKRKEEEDHLGKVAKALLYLEYSSPTSVDGPNVVVFD